MLLPYTFLQAALLMISRFTERRTLDTAPEASEVLPHPARTAEAPSKVPALAKGIVAMLLLRVTEEGKRTTATSLAAKPPTLYNSWFMMLVLVMRTWVASLMLKL